VEKTTHHQPTQARANGSGFTLFKGLLFGAAAGATAAILMAPRSGQETQAELRRRSSELKDEAERRAVELRQRAGEGVKDARLGVADWLETQASHLRGLEPERKIQPE